MKKYDIMLRILDNICNTAPDNFRSYHFEGKNEQEIDSIRSKAYIHLFLLVKFGISDFKMRHDYITDGSADGGLDAYYIDEESKLIYLIQSKFRTSSSNFENKEISADELTAMEIDRILDGCEEGDDGVPYNGKIRGFQEKLSKVSDLPRYKYKIIVFANLKNDRLLEKLFGKYEREIFNYEKTYSELVFPVCSSTYYRNQKIIISMDIEGKIEEVNETFDASFGNCDVTLLFVPLIDIAKMIGKYKNSILEYNPRNYLSMRKNSVNKNIETSVGEDNYDFSLLNNGITLICSQYQSTTRTGKKNTIITIEDPQIINGGQTAYTLSKIYENSDSEKIDKLKNKKVLLKVISICKDDEKEKEYRDFVNKISDATNKQTKIDEADRRANQSSQIELQNDIFNKFGLFYERKAGEFEEALSKKIVDNGMIIKRDILLKVIWAYNGKCGEARNNSGDKIFKKDVFDNIMNNRVSTEKAIYAYMIYMKILDLEKKYKKREYNCDEWGNAIRYGKFALITALAIKYKNDEEFNDDNLDERLLQILNEWKGFEESIREKETNDRYFESADEYDNYYKSINVNTDVYEYFSVE